MELSLLDVLSGQSQRLVDEYRGTNDTTVIRACVLTILQGQSLAQTSHCVDGFRCPHVSFSEPSNLEAAATIAGNTVSLALAGPDLDGRFSPGRSRSTAAARIGPYKTDGSLERDGDFSGVYAFTRGA